MEMECQHCKKEILRSELCISVYCLRASEYTDCAAGVVYHPACFLLAGAVDALTAAYRADGSDS